MDTEEPGLPEDDLPEVSDEDARPVDFRLELFLSALLRSDPGASVSLTLIAGGSVISGDVIPWRDPRGVVHPL